MVICYFHPTVQAAKHLDIFNDIMIKTRKK